MNPWEAMEAAFIMKPFMPAYNRETEVTARLKNTIDAMRDDGGIEFLRMIALMYHLPVDDIIKDEAVTPEQLFLAFIHGLNANELPSLLAFAQTIGILSVRFGDDV